ncbi:hypothetical protein RB195_014987 [Necator americanus]|uniref:Uncharacterized protein n=1 Tax=Necator americanus TaxID=51031 RepID=A0ABR1E2G4_NECAM
MMCFAISYYLCRDVPDLNIALSNFLDLLRERIILNRLIEHRKESTRKLAFVLPGQRLTSDIVLAPSGCPLNDLKYDDEVAIFAEKSTKLHNDANLVSKPAAAYGVRLRLDQCKQMSVSLRPQTGIRVDRQAIELIDEFCYLGCMLKNNGSHEKDILQRCGKVISAFNFLIKCLWSTSIINQLKLRVYLSAIRPNDEQTNNFGNTIYGDGEALTEWKLLRWLLCYF